MTRFLYIADTHLGANPMGYQQQKGYPEKLPEILSALCRNLSASGGVDFVLHGGDMIDSTTEGNMVAAIHAFDLPVPVYLCLGNHDLTTRDAAAQWLRLAPAFFIGRSVAYTVESVDCLIHVAPSHWCDEPYYWNGRQTPRFDAAQLRSLAQALSKSSELPHILLTHSPVFGLPEKQTGMSEPYHPPDAVFTKQVSEMARRHPNLKCVLGAHNHMNMRVTHDGIEFVTVSSLVETPFDFKLFDVTPGRIRMTTIALHSTLTFDGGYDATRHFVLGSDDEREFSAANECCRAPKG